VVQPQQQPHFQIKGVQPDEVLSNEPQQPITTNIPFHQILTKQKERKEPQTPSIS
jgi:hypothetical protein